MLGQPGFQRPLLLHVFLQLHQGRQAGLQARQVLHVGLGGGLGAAALGIRFRHAAFQGGQRFLGFLELVLAGDTVAGQLLQAHRIRAVQFTQFLLQALAALVQRLHLAVGVALRLGHQGQILFDAGQRGAHLVAPRGGFAHPLLHGRQRGLGVLGLGPRLFGAGGARGQVFLGLGDLFGAMFALGGPLADLLLQLVAARLQAVAGIDHVADFGFQAADLRVGLVQPALGGMHRVAGGVMGLAAGLQRSFARPQAGDGGFQLVLGLRHLLGLLGAFFARPGFLQEPQRVLLLFTVGLELAVAPGHFGLRLQLFQLAVEFAQDVFDAGQVLARVGQAVFGLAAPFLVARHPGRLFQEHPQFFGARLDQAVDHALADDGVAAGAQAGAQEDVVDVAAADLLVVDEVAAGAVAGQHAAHRDFRVGAPLAGGAPLAVVEHHFHRGPRRRLAVAGAVENDVLHGLAAQFRGLGLAQHPAHGINDVRFSAAIGTHHTHQLAGHGNHGGIDEGLEAGEF